MDTERADYRATRIKTIPRDSVRELWEIAFEMLLHLDGSGDAENVTKRAKDLLWFHAPSYAYHEEMLRHMRRRSYQESVGGH